MTEMPPPPDEPVEPVEPTQPDEPTARFPVSDETPGAHAVGYPQGETLESAPTGGSRRGLVIGSVAAVLAVLAGAAVYATTVLSGGGRQPDELVPRSTFAYAKVDLDPAAGQKLAARSFFEKFPKLKGKTGTGDENTFEKVLEDLISDGDIDYKTDVQPWFDRRAAVAAFPAPGDTVVTVSVLRSKDDAKARVSLDKIARTSKSNGDDLAYTISKGYVVLSDTQAHVDEALKQSDAASLRDNDVYRKDVDTLTGDQVATAWVDIAPAFKAALAGIPQGGLLPTAIADQIKGRVVAGLHFAGDYVEVEGKGYGIDPRLALKGAEPKLLKTLPATTVAAFSFNDLGTSIGTALSTSGFDVASLVDGYLDGTGLTFRDDLLPLLGTQTVLALGNVVESFDSIKVALLSAVTDAVKAKASGTKVAAALQQFGLPAKAEVKGNTFYLAVPDGYADDLANGSGGLGESEKFSKAMGDLGAPGVAVYVDLQAFVGAIGDPNLGALRSLGAVAGFENGVAYFRERVVVG